MRFSQKSRGTGRDGILWDRQAPPLDGNLHFHPVTRKIHVADSTKVLFTGSKNSISLERKKDTLVVRSTC
jgi:hypothetical protein